jgi:hypothetical protein
LGWLLASTSQFSGTVPWDNPRISKKPPWSELPSLTTPVGNMRASVLPISMVAFDD